jgi:putative ATPase
LAGGVPPALRDAHYPGAKRLQHGKGYRYPHEFPGGVVRQTYLPDELADREYYRPSDRGAERAAAARLATLRDVVRGRSGEEET